MSEAQELLAKTVAAHGGVERWQSIAVIEGAFSSGGLAFSSRMQPFALRNLGVAVAPHRRVVAMTDYCRPGWYGIWKPNHVEIRDESNRIVASRDRPRERITHVVKRLVWDKLDMLYFAGYAVWNYLSFPFLLLEQEVIEVNVCTSDIPGNRRLEVRFEEGFPTHSSIQSFHLDADGVLTRHDYTADVIGSWASAANFCVESKLVDNMRMYTRRRVYPRLGRQTVLPFPTLVWIELDNLVVRNRLNFRDGWAA